VIAEVRDGWDRGGVITKGKRGRDHCVDGTVLHLDCGGAYTNLLVINNE